MPSREATHYDLLVRSSGQSPASGIEAILKGCLEADTPIHAVFAPQGLRFGGLGEIARNEKARNVFRAHDLRLMVVETVTRGLTLARHAARRGQRSVVLVSAEARDEAAAALREWSNGSPETANVCVIFEDDAEIGVGPSSGRLASDLGACVLAVADVSGLRGAVERSLHLARAARCFAALIVDRSILESIETLECHPNRVSQTSDIEALIHRRRRRRFRAAESDDVFTVARRLDVNAVENLPSPGERVELGVIQVGPAGPALRHVLSEFELEGRLPILDLAMVWPIDRGAIERLLGRCRNVVVLEPHPGEVEGLVLSVAEAMRRTEIEPASVWGRVLPPDENGVAVQLGPGDAVHPSKLGRRIVHILHGLRPSHQVKARLVADPLHVSFADAPLISTKQNPAVRISSMLHEVAQWVASRSAPDGNDESDIMEPTHVLLEGRGEAVGRVVQSEVWSARRFVRCGRAAVLQMIDSMENWLLVVHSTSEVEMLTAERLLESMVSEDRGMVARSERASLNDPLELRQKLRSAVLRNGTNVVFVDARPPHATAETGEIETPAEIDASGFQRVSRVVHAADDACNVRQALPVDDPTFHRVERKTHGGVSYSVDRLPDRLKGQFLVRLRPLFETVTVIRSAPPRSRSRRTRHHAAPPVVIHGNQSTWRACIVGTRATHFGVAARSLIEAAAIQGYNVRAIRAEAHEAPADDGHVQLLFSRASLEGTSMPLVQRVPFGELDLLLVGDANLLLTELNVIAPTCDPARTTGAINFDSDRDDDAAVSSQIEEVLRQIVMRDRLERHPFSRVAERVFGTGRPTDMVMLGFAFQRGWIPLREESIERGIERVETNGYSRLRDAFDVGRAIANDDGALRRDRGTDLSIQRLLRRSHFILHMEGGRTRSMAPDFRRAVEEAIAEMPGLNESEGGRLALRDFVRAMDRLVRRGGMSEARMYRDLVVNAYRADRGDRGRSLTRHAVLPLASAMLIRDSNFLSTMTLSLEGRRMARARLNVQPSRGDELIRRFLNRFEIVAFGWRLRVDFRSSDWTALVVRRASSLWPGTWRGTFSDRARRRYVIDLIERATRGAGHEYDLWDQRLRELHELAERHRLRHFSARALEMVLEPREADIAPGGAEHAGGPSPNADQDAVLAEVGDADDQDDTGMPIAQG